MDEVLPYHLLSPSGVTPETSIKGVADSIGYFMEQGEMGDDIHKAWDQLATIKSRLLIDFFLFRVTGDSGHE